MTAEQFEYLTMARTSARSLLAVINDILDFSKIEAGKLDLDPLEFPVQQDLYDCIKPLAYRAQEKGVEMVLDISPETPRLLRGDPLRLRQIVTNLVGNAIKFTAHGEIVVGVDVEQQDGGGVCLHFAVKDTGIGIPVDKQNAIFEAFSQADVSTTRKFGGTGLGLAISLRLVRLMGGRLWVESQAGKGSQFHFTAQFETVADGEQLAPQAQQFTGKRALVVDDNASSLRVLANMLRHWGLDVATASGGEEALALALHAKDEKRPFSLLLTDGEMPGMNGVQLIEQVRQAQRNPPAVILMTTAGADAAEAARARKTRLAGRLTKPIWPEDLRAATLQGLSGAATPAVASAAAAAGLKSKHPLRVLLAEDNPVNQVLAVRILSRRGHSVAVVGNGREALLRLGQERFDLLLTDMQMPEMDGFETAEAIRRQERETGARLPIVAMTAMALKGDRERCLAVGMDAYVSKPVRQSELLETIERFAAPVQAIH